MKKHCRCGDQINNDEEVCSTCQMEEDIERERDIRDNMRIS